VKAARQRYYRSHREDVLAKQRAYRGAGGDARRVRERERQRRARAENPERHRAKGRRWYAHHREEERERRARNREREHERQRQWYEQNKARAFDNAARRRARKRGAFVEDVERAAVFARDQGLCGICGELVDPECFDLDHIVPLAAGGVHAYRNVQVAHPACNKRKGATIPAAAYLAAA
jgi:5-methylcytosine-specific restriction endonuclease McrA